ncbi:FAD-dependent monooxygenase [Nocardia terrae]|uniref:FAD-dependent monooxygenase n=1 Tax=Nocardia terrae TaxID=2675851 RepID=UPI002E26E90F
MADAEVEVLIVGGGPVGLTARALLDRWGVRTLLVERHPELSPFPRSRLVNVRSMEIFRQLGLAETIRERAFGPEFGRVRFRETLGARDFGTEAMVGVRAPIPESPEIGVVTSQDRLEPTLLGATDTPVLVERVPVAHRTLRQAVTNAERVRAAQAARRARRDSADTGDVVELPWSERYFDQIGLILGVGYDSDAVRSDGSTPPDGDAVYIPSGRPGVRMPHVRLESGRSSLDALGEWFTVLTPDPSGWEKAVTAKVPLHIEQLPDESTDVFGIGRGGAVLVRPDGHIGARWPELPDGPVNL